MTNFNEKVEELFEKCINLKPEVFDHSHYPKLSGMMCRSDTSTIRSRFMKNQHFGILFCGRYNRICWRHDPFEDVDLGLEARQERFNRSFIQTT